MNERPFGSAAPGSGSRGRGVVAWSTYVPRHRLDLGAVPAVAGTGGGRGSRSLASYDEDATTLGVEAARPLAATGDLEAVSHLWFATTAPPYLDKTNATAIHAALRLPRQAAAFDVGGSVRSAAGALSAALGGRGDHLVVGSDLRSGLPGSPDEASGGDGASALVIGGGDPDEVRPVAAEVIGRASATEEFLDRWRVPGEVRSRLWEERFGETRYVPLGQRAWDVALGDAGCDADQVAAVALAGPHQRACTALARSLGVEDRRVDPLTGVVGTTGAAQPAMLLAAALERATPGQVLALVVLADGADVFVLRATEHIGAAQRRCRSLDAEGDATRPIDYATYLRWRGLLPTEPPRRPEPARPSAAAAARSTEWKYAFVGSSAEDGTVHLPPRPGDPGIAEMAGAQGTIATFTVDRLAYSPSPPIVFAIVDFDGGGRAPVELTDVSPDEVRIGARVELTFRKLFTAEGIHNYFWKARLAGGCD